MKGILDFFDVFPAVGFDIPAEQAIDSFKAKGLKPSFSYADLINQEHAASFTIAKMMDVDLLADVQKSLDEALTQGLSFTDWADQLIPTLQAKGWWGRKAVLDPLTGQTVVAQLGSPARLQTIFRTNMLSAYSAGSWQQMKDQEADAPYLLYDAVDDFRTRPEHHAWDNTCLPMSDKWWKTHYPPNGWNCRCHVIQLDDADLEKLGITADQKAPRDGKYEWTNPRTGKVENIPNGIDPGFDFNAGQARYKELQKLLSQKVDTLPDDSAIAARAAIKEMNKALEEKTPYLAGAIKQLQGKSPELSPVQLLNEAKAKAAKAKQSHYLSDFKGSMLSGKKPSAAQQAAFDSLPKEAQQAFLKEIEQQSAVLKANAEATAKLDEFKSASPGSAQGKALAALQKTGELDGIPVIEQVAKLDAKVIEVKQAKSVIDLLSNYKKAILSGKIPSEAQTNAFKALPQEQQDAFLAKVKAEKAPTVTAQPEAPSATIEAKPKELDGANLTQIGPQAGSNPGGLFQDTTTGEKWYIKFPDSMEVAKNEALTAKLYQLAGIDAPDYQFVTVDGKQGIASRFIDGLQTNKAALVKGAPGVADGFAVDAWLANWDSVGMGFDNMLVKDGKAFRVDTGGGLRFRAQGGMKGSAFGDKVTEIDSLRDPRTNKQAAQVFGKLTDKQIEDSVRRVLQIRDADIENLVEAFGPANVNDRVKLAETIIARKRDLYDRFPNARPEGAPKPAPIADAGQRVTAVEQKTILDSRSNGYAIRTDSGDIEDHNVTVSVFNTEGGGTLTRTQMKLTPDAGARLEKLIAQNSAGEVSVVADPSILNSEIVQLLKGINSRADKGGVLEQVNIDRWQSLKGKMEDALQDLVKASAMSGVDDAQVTIVENYLSDWYEKLAQVMQGKTANSPAVKVEGIFKGDSLQKITRQPQASEAQTGVAWTKTTRWNNQVAETKRGHATLTKQTYAVPGVETAFTAEVEGAKVTYVPFKGNNSGRSFQGTLTIEKNGSSTTITGDTLSALEQLGIKATRSTDSDRLELYLNKHARLYTVSDANMKAKFEALADIASQEERIAKKLELVNQIAGTDISKSPYFGTYDGQYQAFGHGRAQQMRADLKDSEFNAFAKKYTIYNNPTGLGTDAHDGMMLQNLKNIIESGGMYVSRAEMVRRGIPMSSGTSVSADISTGGGNYIFTRIKSASSTKGGGLYWKSSVLRRVDAISYTGDEFGNTHDNYLATRKIDPSGWAVAARSSRNETIFKDGLSLFDELDSVLFTYSKNAQELIQFMRDHGYTTWPDGRSLEEVIKTKG